MIKIVHRRREAVTRPGPYAAGDGRAGDVPRAWRESCDRALALCLELDPDDWDRPTDLPGWTVRDVLAHLAHIETVLADGDPDADESSAGGREVFPEWTNRGVEARRGTSPDALRAELNGRCFAAPAHWPRSRDPIRTAART